MAYEAEISRQNPSCILFLLDQSGSMADRLSAESDRTKAQGLTTAINRLLYELVIRCTKDHTEGVRNYYDVGVISYGSNVGPALGGALMGRPLVTIRDVAENPADIEDRRRQAMDDTGQIVEEVVKFPIWFKPVASGGTPMCEALNMARATIQEWVNNHQSSFPPIVINITDGESTDGNPISNARALKELSTTDGNVLLFNLHLSSRSSKTVLYPESVADISEELASTLFEMSSLLPPHLQDSARAEGFTIGSRSRGFGYNANIVEVIRFINIGTRPRALR
jgi:hypothetical protein